MNLFGESAGKTDRNKYHRNKDNTKILLSYLHILPKTNNQT